MNDTGEFEYARRLVYEVLDEMTRRADSSGVMHSIASYTRINLEQSLKDTVDMARAYCACMTVSADHSGQWETYASAGRGFAIGFDLPRLLSLQKPNVQNEQQY